MFSISTIMLIVQVLLAVALIALILVQQGRGADTGATFGAGASGTVFGARGSATFLTRTTAILALLFFSNSFLLSYLATKAKAPKSVMEQLVIPPAPADKPADSKAADLPPIVMPSKDTPAIAAPKKSPDDLPPSAPGPADKASTGGAQAPGTTPAQNGGTGGKP